MGEELLSTSSSSSFLVPALPAWAPCGTSVGGGECWGAGGS